MGYHPTVILDGFFAGRLCPGFVGQQELGYFSRLPERRELTPEDVTQNLLTTTEPIRQRNLETYMLWNDPLIVTFVSFLHVSFVTHWDYLNFSTPSSLEFNVEIFKNKKSPLNEPSLSSLSIASVLRTQYINVSSQPSLSTISHQRHQGETQHPRQQYNDISMTYFFSRITPDPLVEKNHKTHWGKLENCLGIHLFIGESFWFKKRRQKNELSRYWHYLNIKTCKITNGYKPL